MSHYLDPVEQRLHDDAERLLSAHGTQPPIEQILALHERERSRRTACGVVLGVAMAAAVVGLARLGSRESLEEGVANSGRALNHATIAARSAHPGDLADVPGNRQDPGRRSAPVLVISQLDDSGSQAVIFLLAEPGGDKPRVLATGVYLPERMEQKKLSDFSPAEQAAIRQVLGLNEPVTLHEPI